MADRWATKIVALPIFSDAFSKAVLKSPFANLTFVLAMEVRSAQEFALKVSEWAPQLDAEFRDDLLRSPFLLEQFWTLAFSVEKPFLESTVTQLGFGLCEAPLPPISAETARARRVGAIKALTEKPAHPPKKFLKTATGPASATPLLDQENAARWKWAARLEAIGKKAGSFSKLLLETTNESGLSAAEIARLRQLVLSSGAPRTMAVHVSNWERFAEWAESREIELHPVTSAKLIQYALHLDKNECGPSVIPTFRTSVKWVTSKLAIECPDVDHAGLLAIQSEVISKRAKTLKEAVPIPTAVVRCLELFVMDDGEPEAARLFVWWWLCMVFASLRYDDAMHVKPNELAMSEEGMFGVAWQTKVERKRRGTKFVVPHVGFSGVDWLREGWGLLQNEDLDRDFWIRDLNTREAFRSAPAQYQRSLQWLRHFATHALRPHDEFKGLEQQILKLTAHSARVTMLDAAVHAGRSTEEIGLQANWKNPGPLVLKYTRNRSAIPAKMVQQLVQDMLVQCHPVETDDTVELDVVDRSALDQVHFYVKTDGARSSYDYRYHCSSAEDDTVLACGRVSIEECTDVGSFLPDPSVLCKHCARARPDVVAAGSA
eukprot:s1365_g6.t1